MDYLVPLVVILVASGFAFALGTRGLARRNEVMGLLLFAMALRIALALVFYAIPQTRIFHEDAGGYEKVGVWLANGWSGEGPPFDLNKSLNYGYFYWTGVLSYVFGPYPLHASLWNALMGCLSALLLYRIAVRLFIPTVAQRTLLLALFFPSMILWSSIAVKETAMLFLLMVMMSCVIGLRRKFSLIHVIGTALALSAILTIRFYVFYMAIFAIVLSLFFSGRRKGRAIFAQVAVIGAIAVTVMFLGLRNEAVENFSIMNFDRLSTVRSGLASTADSGWHGDADVSSPARAIAFMPFGLAFLLFSPFPWQLTSLRPLLTAPEMLLWWGMTFAWLRGLRYAIRARKSDLAPIICFAIILALAYSPMHGNVGVAFRQRAQIAIFLFLFAAVGSQLKRLRARRIPDQAIELGWQKPAADPPPVRAAEALAVASRVSTPSLDTTHVRDLRPGR
jgi:hypothetical protein